ncbi:MAG: RNA methyltransferase [Bacteroidales bacterium]|nr:RNA methyltransferase [Bacteroidales bacterium]
MDYKKVINILSHYVTKERLNCLINVLNNRIATLRVFIENIYQSHNASAIIRSCDAFGIQYIYVLEKNNLFRPNPEISLGSEKWLSITKFSYDSINIKELFNDFKKRGFKIIATDLGNDVIYLNDFKYVNEKLLVMFGSEKTGISDELLTYADVKLKIPLYGFAQSVNVSVATGIIIYSLANKIRTTSGNFSLTEEEKDKILAEWLIKTVPFSDKILSRYSIYINPLLL